MRRKCSYPDCMSGSAADRNFNKTSGLKNKTLFSIPKDPIRRKQWQKALDRSKELAETEVVCELHFNENDIERFYKTILTDGSQVLLDRGKISLVPTAVPVARGDWVVKKIYDPSIPAAHNHFESNLIRDIDTVALHYDMNDNESQYSISNIITDANIDSVIHNVNMTNTSINLPSINITSTNDGIVVETVKDDPEFNAVTNQPAFMNPIQDDVTMKIDDDDVDDITTVNFTDILEDCTNINWPNGWGCAIIMNQLIVAHCNPDGLLIKQFLVKNDSSVTVYIKHKKADISEIINVKSAEDIIHNINIIQPLLLCDGIGYDERYSELCPGFTEPKERVKFGHNRCFFCLAQKRQIIQQKNNSKKKELALLQKYQRTKTNLKIEKQRTIRMQSRLNLLKREVLETRRKCAVACQVILKREISRLPLEQQVIVQGYFDASQYSRNERVQSIGIGA